jgi:hypothetical protein
MRTCRPSWRAGTIKDGVSKNVEGVGDFRVQNVYYIKGTGSRAD